MGFENYKKYAHTSCYQYPAHIPLALTTTRCNCLPSNYLRAYLHGWSPHCPNLRGQKSQEINVHVPEAAPSQQQVKAEG